MNEIQSNEFLIFSGRNEVNTITQKTFIETLFSLEMNLNLKHLLIDAFDSINLRLLISRLPVKLKILDLSSVTLGVGSVEFLFKMLNFKNIKLNSLILPEVNYLLVMNELETDTSVKNLFFTGNTVFQLFDLMKPLLFNTTLLNINFTKAYIMGEEHLDSIFKYNYYLNGFHCVYPLVNLKKYNKLRKKQLVIINLLHSHLGLKLHHDCFKYLFKFIH